MAETRDDIVTMVRSVLTSTKGSCSIHQLRSDYGMLMGCEIPFRKFKFDSLESFLRSEPTLECWSGPQGLMVNARLTDKSAHIAHMINAQKDNIKRPKRNVARYHGRRPVQQRPAYHQNQQGYRGRYANNYQPGGSRGGYNAAPARRPMPPAPPRPSPPLINNNNNVSAKIQPNHQNGRPNQQTESSHNQKAPSTSSQTSPINTNHPAHHLRENGSQPAQPPQDIDERQFHLPAEMASYTINQQVPHSSKTNRSMLLNQAGNSISPTQLMTESIKAFDPKCSVWAFSSDSGEDSTEGGRTHKVYEQSGNPIIDLPNFLKHHRHPPPQITILKRQVKFRHPQCYDCKIVAAGQTFSNYPRDFTSEEQVTKYTCAKALEELIPMLQSDGPSSSLLVSDNNDVLERVPPMIEQHSNGIWNEQFERLYAEKYKEILPTNWLKIIENSPVISIQQASKTLHLLTYCKPEDLISKCSLDMDWTEAI